MRSSPCSRPSTSRAWWCRSTPATGRLQAYGLALDDVAKAVSAGNVVSAVGRLEDHYKLYLVVSDTRFQSIDQIAHTILKTGANGIVELEDVAEVTMATEPQWIRVTADGKDAVLVSIYQQPGSNSVQIAKDVKAKLEGYRSQMPAGVAMAAWYDQSQLVTASAASVRDAILIGIALAAVVLLAFLRSWKITLIAITVVPAVLASTVVLLSVLGMSFNIMTLGGMAAAVGLIVDGWIAFRSAGTGFMPAMDEGGFILDYRSAPGTALSETDRLLRQVEAIVRAVPDVDTYSRRTGAGLGGTLSEANQGDFFIRLKSGPRRPVAVVMEDVSSRVESEGPGLSVEMALLMEDLIGDLTAVPQPIEVKLFAGNPARLPPVARTIAARIAKIPGVVSVMDGINPAGDALMVHVGRVKAAVEGMDPDAVTKALNDYLTGNVTTQIAQGVKMVGVRVWIPGGMRGTDTAVGALPLHAPTGTSCRCGAWRRSSRSPVQL